MIEEPEERYRWRPKTIVTPEMIREIDAHYNGNLIKWQDRHKPLIIRDKRNLEFFHIAATQLYETFKSGNVGALDILDRVIECDAAYPCSQILCPACRSAAQIRAVKKATNAFAGYEKADLRFMTLLICVDADATKLPALIRDFRKTLYGKLNNSTAKLGADFKMLGAFEIDMKNLGTQWDAGLDCRRLIEQLGFRAKPFRQHYLLHLHAIVGGLNEVTESRVTELIEKSLGKELLDDQLQFKRFYENVSEAESLANLASYMFKARLQFADNIFPNGKMQKKTHYHTPYKGKPLVDYLNVINEMQNFKGLKFDFNISG